MVRHSIEADTESSVSVDLKRCVCIHSLAQLIDVTLQSLLYQRQFIPEPVAALLMSSSVVAEQFKITYRKIQTILHDTFRSVNADGRVREFLILVGCTPFSPKELYRIRVPPCEAVEGKRPNDQAEGEAVDGGSCCGAAAACEQLNAKERRLVFSAVALSKAAVAHFEECKVPGKTDKVFMFLRTRGPLCTATEGLEEDESFELPDGEKRRRRKIQQLRIQVNVPCCRLQKRRTGTAVAVENDENVPEAEHEELEKYNEEVDGEEEELGMSTWYRLGPYFTNLGGTA